MDQRPTAKGWKRLLKKVPVEKIELDSSGHYDPEKHSDFHEWVVNG